MFLKQPLRNESIDKDIKQDKSRRRGKRITWNENDVCSVFSWKIVVWGTCMRIEEYFRRKWRQFSLSIFHFPPFSSLKVVACPFTSSITFFLSRRYEKGWRIDEKVSLKDRKMNNSVYKYDTQDCYSIKWEFQILFVMYASCEWNVYGENKREKRGSASWDPRYCGANVSVPLRGTCRQGLLPLQRPGGGGKSTAHAGRAGREPRCIAGVPDRYTTGARGGGRGQRNDRLSATLRLPKTQVGTPRCCPPVSC